MRAVADHLKALWKNTEKKWPGLHYGHFALLSIFFVVKNAMTVLQCTAGDTLPHKVLDALTSIGIEVVTGTTW
eukprot:953646-Pyramimonas_sp.AAC.1